LRKQTGEKLKLLITGCAGKVGETVTQHLLTQGFDIRGIDIADSFEGGIGYRPCDLLDYLPVDEDHPKLTSDAYSFSKQVTEYIGTYFWRRDNISNTCLRFDAGLRPIDEMRKSQGDSFRSARAFAEALSELLNEEAGRGCGRCGMPMMMNEESAGMRRDQGKQRN
jgi:nucleoside-diphosphate-sugar epimerase